MADQIVLHLSEREAEYLKDILDLWMEGCRDSTKAIELDKSIASLDDFIMLTQEIRIIHSDAFLIRDKLWEALNGRACGV